MEAAMIMPLTIFLFCFLFYLTFYLYNKCIVSQDTYILAFRGSLCCDKEADEVRHYVLKQSAAQFGRKYLSLNNLISTVEADSKSVVVKASGRLNTSFTRKILRQQLWKLSIDREASRSCPVEIIRKTRWIKKISEEGRKTDER